MYCFPLDVGDKFPLMLIARSSQLSVFRERWRKCGTCLCPCQHICSVVMAAHFDVPENALPDVVDTEEVERALAVSTALQWVNESFTEELWGLVPSNQAEVDHRLRYSPPHSCRV